MKVISFPSIYGILFQLIEFLGYDPDQIIIPLTREVQTDGFLDRIRFQPATAQVALLDRRLRQSPVPQGKKRQTAGRKLVTHFPDESWHPGCRADNHTFWIFPVCVSNPNQSRQKLEHNGFDATLDSTGLTVVPVTPNHCGVHPVEVAQVMSNILYSPVDSSIS